MDAVNIQPLCDKKRIAKKVKALRKARGVTQGYLAGLLHLSQSRLSEIEGGQGSFSAEQFLRILRYFNVTVNHFDGEGQESGPAIQKALARLGAAHLVEDPDILPSEQLEQVDAVIRETLVEGGAARSITALAPVLVNHINRVNLPKLYAQFKDYGLERRLGWLIENVALAIQESLSEPWPRSYVIRLRKSEAALLAFNEWLLGSGTASTNGPADTLGFPILSAKTREELQSEASAPSLRWNILTTIQVEDFAKAIKESHVADAH